MKTNTATNPSSLLGDPPGDLLGEDEADDESDDVGEEAANSALNDRHGDPVAEAEQRQHAAPRDPSVAEQSARTHAHAHSSPYNCSSATQVN